MIVPRYCMTLTQMPDYDENRIENCDHTVCVSTVELAVAAAKMAFVESLSAIEFADATVDPNR